MAQGNVYKPRYTIASLAKSKVWPYKDSYLRRFYALRARRVQRGGLFRRCVLVATSRKWTIARRAIRPFQRRAGVRSVAGSGGKTAFGRPKKRRYRDSFYVKQQLRYFHGKRKEYTFRYLFQHNQSTIAYRSNSFFSSLESRLDRFFFRRRLMPTIYACHQFIQHQGLYVNGSLEYSPRAQVSVGDRVTVPTKAFKPLYWDVFCRVYYRRWGLYIFRRRQYTQLKKKVYSILPRRRRALFRVLAKRYPLATSIRKFKKNFFFKFIKKDRLVNSKLKSKRSRLAINGFGVSPISKTIPVSFRSASYNIVRSKELTPKIPSQIQALFKEFANSTYASTDFRSRLRPFNLNQDRSFILKGAQKRNTNLNRSSLVKASDYKKRFYRYMGILFKSFPTEGIAVSKENTFHKKLHLLQKLVYALRLQKTVQPSLRRFRKTLQSSRNTNTTRLQNYYRPYKRSLILRFFKKRRKKIIRRQKFARLKTVHFFLPSYMQMDFRTLRAVKIESPSQEDIYHSFRGSRSEVYAFYASRGFL